MVVDITLEELNRDYDWAQVFADENAGNVSDYVREAMPGSGVSLDKVSRSKVVEIIAAVNGENEGASWTGVFRLNDGRFLYASGGCDYTGWDCRAGNCLIAANTLDEIVRFALSEEERERLGFPPITIEETQ